MYLKQVRFWHRSPEIERTLSQALENSILSGQAEYFRSTSYSSPLPPFLSSLPCHPTFHPCSLIPRLTRTAFEKRPCIIQSQNS